MVLWFIQTFVNSNESLLRNGSENKFSIFLSSKKKCNIYHLCKKKLVSLQHFFYFNHLAHHYLWKKLEHELPLTRAVAGCAPSREPEREVGDTSVSVWRLGPLSPSRRAPIGTLIKWGPCCTKLHACVEERCKELLLSHPASVRLSQSL